MQKSPGAIALSARGFWARPLGWSVRCHSAPGSYRRSDARGRAFLDLAPCRPGVDAVEHPVHQRVRRLRPPAAYRAQWPTQATAASTSAGIAILRQHALSSHATKSPHQSSSGRCSAQPGRGTNISWRRLAIGDDARPSLIDQHTFGFIGADIDTEGQCSWLSLQTEIRGRSAPTSAIKKGRRSPVQIAPDRRPSQRCRMGVPHGKPQIEGRHPIAHQLHIAQIGQDCRFGADCVARPHASFPLRPRVFAKIAPGPDEGSRR